MKLSPHEIQGVAEQVAAATQALGMDVIASDVRKRFSNYTLERHADFPDKLARILLEEQGTKKRRKSGTKQRTIPPGLRPPEWSSAHRRTSQLPLKLRPRSSDD
jgi:hypothetical protein